MITEKACSKCKEIKPLEEYYKEGSRWRGVCKPCFAVGNREYRANNAGAIKAAQREYQSKNRERIAAVTREYYMKNREKIAAGKREYQAKNREKIASAQREYRVNNREKRSADKREYRKTRRKTDPAYRMAYLLRMRLNSALRGRGKKSASTEQLLGCTFNEARAHIEMQFKEGMSWDKPGSFHIDHIIPCSRFDLTNPIHQRMCFHWLNLQPLTPEDNMRKGDKLPPNHVEFLEVLEVMVDGRPL